MFVNTKIIYKINVLLYNKLMDIILASKSPRRKEILSDLGIKFKIIPAVGDEVVDLSLPKDKIVENIARHKAEEIFARYPDCAVIAADTIVVLNNEILQKPKDNADERRMLDALSGNTHTVYTGYALITPQKRISGAESTLVTFNCLSEQLKQDYVKSGFGLDKAGGYGIQDGVDFVASYSGSYYNVMGFPKETFEKLLVEFGLKN